MAKSSFEILFLIFCKTQIFKCICNLQMQSAFGPVTRIFK